MYTDHEEGIRVYTITFPPEEEKLTFQRLERLYYFIGHLGFLVGAFSSIQDKIIYVFVEPHDCPCTNVPYRDKLTLLDVTAIEKFCTNNNLIIEAITTLAEYQNVLDKEELQSIETEVAEFV